MPTQPDSAQIAPVHAGLAQAVAERRRRVRRSALACALIAAAFYFAFILMALLREAR
jgi:hypothetical protein